MAGILNCRNPVVRARALKWVCAWGLLFGLPMSVSGQTAQSYEYMTASSRLKSGGVVTSQSLPGQGISTVITPGSLGWNHAIQPTSGYFPGGVGSGTGVSNSASAAAATGGAVPVPALPISAVPVPGVPNSAVANSSGEAILSSPPVTVYPYPAYSPQWLGYQPPQAAPGGSQVWIPGSAAPQAAWQVPTLGITNNTVLRPNVSAVSVDNSAAAIPPEIRIEVPGGSNPPAVIGNPALGAGLASSGMTAPRYQPLVKLQNLPPGTYLGQGVIGQPKAYVDGQPMRNLLRYILP